MKISTDDQNYEHVQAVMGCYKVVILSLISYLAISAENTDGVANATNGAVLDCPPGHLGCNSPPEIACLPISNEGLSLLISYVS